MSGAVPCWPATGFIGVGNMGGAMAARLLDHPAAPPVWVRDIDATRESALAAAGARVAPSAAALAREVQLLVIAVVDAAQVREVLFGADGAPGAADTLPAGATVMLCPTIAPEDVEDCAGQLAARGMAVLDAPMSGGPARARDGSMSLMVAGADAVVARHEPCLRWLAARLFRVGERVGDGARTKLVNNLLAGINLVGAAEAIALAERLGLDAARTLAVMGESSGQSWIGSDRMARALAGDFAPRAHMTLLAKDTALAMAAARRAGFEGPLGGAATATFARALDAGLAALDDGALLTLLRQRLRQPSYNGSHDLPRTHS